LGGLLWGGVVGVVVGWVCLGFGSGVGGGFLGGSGCVVGFWVSWRLGCVVFLVCVGGGLGVGLGGEWRGGGVGCWGRWCVGGNRVGVEVWFRVGFFVCDGEEGVGGVWVCFVCG